MRTRSAHLALVVALGCVCVTHAAAQETVYTQTALVEDARQLVAAIESAHPDPYMQGGGTIAFHRRFQQTLAAILPTGMTVAAFHRLLLPLVAAVGDGHTAIRLPQSSPRTPSGLPLQLGIVERCMYVQNQVDLDGEHLLGGRLSAVEGIGFDELLARQNHLRGIENEYGTMALLGRSLQTREGLKALVPEWGGRNTLAVELLLPDGRTRAFHIPLDAGDTSRSVLPSSRVTMPDLEHSDIAFCFLGEGRDTALLVIKDMMAYREGGETWMADGLSEAGEFINAAYSRFHSTAPPQDVRAALAAIPSATEVFRDLVIAMKHAKTKTLLVDLRGNGGGNGFMSGILLYFLYGDSAMRGYDEGYSISRYSDLYFQVYTTATLADINKGRAVALEKGDYDFSEEEQYRSHRQVADFDKEIAKSPTFSAFYRKGEQSGLPSPPRVIVLCSPLTYSSGFNLMTALQNKGATIVGTPSAQPGNNFGDSLILRLKNTGIQAFVAFKQILSFPDDPARGRSLPVDTPLTYRKLASYGFDPNAEVLLALEAR
ncbi:MAG: hypothetical protein LAO05_15655 [Acidobacteriia bacterium]|nr:hypothetical protein [Terriglobia bacterium]